MHGANPNGDDEQLQKDIDLLVRTFPPRQENLIPLLQAVQAKMGYLSPSAMQTIASHLNMPKGKVFGVATFFRQFRFSPPGKHPIKVCLGTACHLRGGNIILEEWERQLHIREGEVTEDRRFSLDRVACVGCCALAPVVVIGTKDVRGNMSPTAVEGILLQFSLKDSKPESGNSEE